MDPFTLVYNKLWQLVEEDVELSRMVREGNRIKFSKTGTQQDVDPRIKAVTAGGSPELMLLPDYFLGNVTQDNNSARLTRHYTWVIRTATRMAHVDLFPVEYRLFWLFSQNTTKKALMELTYNNEPFIQSPLQIVQGSQIIPEIDSKSSTLEAWRSMWNVSIEMTIPTK